MKRPPEPSKNGKGSVALVTDSTSDIPAELAASLGISIIPCQVYLGGESFWDGEDLLPDEFFARVAASSDLPRTAQPPVSRFVDVYRHQLEVEGFEAVLSLHVASTLSGTVNAAWAAAQMLSEPWRVEVIDTGQLSMGAGWAVVEAARLAQTGAIRATVSRAAHDLLPRLRVAAMLDTLENLYKGGRISQVTAALGSAFRIKPLLGVRGGQVSVLGRVRTRSRALKRLADLVRGWGPLARVAVLHTGAEELAVTLAEMLGSQFPDEGSMLAPAGPALTTHLGIGAVGVCALLETKT
jgi:DegV family protein with EDD domain